MITYNYLRRFLTALLGSILILAPSLAFGAYNDVTLTTAVTITAGGHNFTVSGNSATLSSIVVNSSNFVITLLPNSSFTVSSSEKLNFDYNPSSSSGSFSTTCTASASTLSGSYAISSGSSMTITIAPLTTTCSTTAATTASTGGGNGPIVSSGGGGGGGGSGGGSSIISAPSSQTSVSSAVNNLVSQLNALQNSIPKGTTGPSACWYTFKKNLKVGSNNSDVKLLQKILNKNVDTQVAASGPGSIGHEQTYYGAKTASAVKRFQEKYASLILKPVGLKKGTGTFLSGTRAALNGLCIAQ